MDETIEGPIYQHSTFHVDNFVIEREKCQYELMHKYYGNGFLNDETTKYEMSIYVNKCSCTNEYRIDLHIWKRTQHLFLLDNILQCVLLCEKDSNNYKFFKTPKNYKVKPIQINKTEGDDGMIYYTLSVQKTKKPRPLSPLSTYIKEKRDWECGICYKSNLKFYTQPMFNCSHEDFCCSCIRSMNRNRLYQCPKCREPALFA